MRYAGPHASQIALQLVFATIWVASQLVIPWLMADIIDNGILRSDMAYIVQRGLLLMIGASVVNVASLLVSLWFLTRVSAGISRDLRADLFEKVIDWTGQARQAIAAP